METSLSKYTKKFGLKPVNVHNVLHFYIPANGVVCYSGLSINVMNPSLIARLFPRRDVTNVLLFGTWIGTGLYIYNRRHLSKVPRNTRIMYSGFAASMFGLGSVLLWAVLRNVLPRNNALSMLVGLSSGFVLLRIGEEYLQFLDSQHH